jgi:DNA-binding transcriptional LysR family regulator
MVMKTPRTNPSGPEAETDSPGHLPTTEVEIELQHLQCFVAAAEELDLSRAPASLSQLEALIGAPLFIQDADGLKLTRTGREFLPAARRILAKVEDAFAGAMTRALPAEPRPAVKKPSRSRG